MSEKRGTLVVEIFKPKRGSTINWVGRENAKTIYVFDVLFKGNACPPLYKFPIDIVEEINKMWDMCIRSDIDYLRFECPWYYD